MAVDEHANSLCIWHRTDQLICPCDSRLFRSNNHKEIDWLWVWARSIKTQRTLLFSLMDDMHCILYERVAQQYCPSNGPKMWTLDCSLSSIVLKKCGPSPIMFRFNGCFPSSPAYFWSFIMKWANMQLYIWQLSSLWCLQYYSYIYGFRRIIYIVE